MLQAKITTLLQLSHLSYLTHQHRSSTPALMDPLATAETVNVLPFWVVGNDAGFFPQLQPDVTTLLMGPGERYDVVIDFTREQKNDMNACDCVLLSTRCM